jgi:hypothetical protein
MQTVQSILVLNNLFILNLLPKRIGLITVGEFDFQEAISSDVLDIKPCTLAHSGQHGLELQ